MELHIKIIKKILEKNGIHVSEERIKKIKVGKRSRTYHIILKHGNDNGFIVQLYDKEFQYQAYKKQFIYKLCKNVNIPVPQVIDVGCISNKTYLVTKKLTGEVLTSVNVSKKNRHSIMSELGSILEKIHKNIREFDSYGWITTQKVEIPYIDLIEYLEREIKRFNIWMGENFSRATKKEILNKAKKILKNIEEFHQTFSPTLVWYDIYPENILVMYEKNARRFKISGILDPGAARVGIPEWDLAHAKLYLCVDEKEFNRLLRGYSNITNNFPNKNLLDLFCTWIIIDDLALAAKISWNDLMYKCLKLLQAKS